MYQQAEILQAATHQLLCLSNSLDFRFARNLASVPLLQEEVHIASTWYPIVFNHQGPRRPLALLGLNNSNRYLAADGRWTVPYIPAFVRRYPFTLGAATSAQTDQTPQHHLMIDRAAPHFSEKGAPLFDSNGQPTPVVQQALTFLNAYQTAAQHTEHLHQALFDAKAVIDKTLSVAQGQQLHAIGGFAIADEAVVYALSDATLATWARNGLLATVYAHWASLRHLEALVAAEAAAQQVHPH